MEQEHLEEVAQVLRGTDIMVLSDEIYAELTYGGKHVSIASLEGMRERTVVVNGFSKAYAMTGWRLGYAAAPAPVIGIMTKIHQFAIMCAPTTSQHAAIEALKNCDEEIERMREEYNVRRQFCVNSLNRLGLSCHDPKGTFYVFPSIQSTGLTSDAFCQQLLRQKHVAVVPGSAFGESGEAMCAFSYSYSVNHLVEAMRRIEEFLQEMGVL
jgi:aminotransferase